MQRQVYWTMHYSHSLVWLRQQTTWLEVRFRQHDYLVKFKQHDYLVTLRQQDYLIWLRQKKLFG